MEGLPNAMSLYLILFFVVSNGIIPSALSQDESVFGREWLQTSYQFSGAECTGLARKTTILALDKCYYLENSYYKVVKLNETKYNKYKYSDSTCVVNKTLFQQLDLSVYVDERGRWFQCYGSHRKGIINGYTDTDYIFKYELGDIDSADLYFSPTTTSCSNDDFYFVEISKHSECSDSQKEEPKECDLDSYTLNKIRERCGPGYLFYEPQTFFTQTNIIIMASSGGSVLYVLIGLIACFLQMNVCYMIWFQVDDPCKVLGDVCCWKGVTRDDKDQPSLYIQGPFAMLTCLLWPVWPCFLCVLGCVVAGLTPREKGKRRPAKHRKKKFCQGSSELIFGLVLCPILFPWGLYLTIQVIMENIKNDDNSDGDELE